MPDDKKVKVIIESEFKSKGTKEAAGAIEKLGSRVKKTGEEIKKNVKEYSDKIKKGGEQINKTNSEIDTTLESLGNRFRYLSLVVGTTAGAMVLALKNVMNTAKETEGSIMSLAVISARQGENFEEVQKAVEELTRTGLIPFQKAAEVIRNLMLTGLGAKEALEVAKRLLARSLVMRDAQYDVADAVVATTSGLAYYKEQLADALLIQGVFSLAIDRLKARTGKTAKELSNLAIQQEAARIYSERSADMVNLLSDAQNTLTGVIGRAKTATYEFSKALADSLLPFIAPLIDGLTALKNLITKLTRSTSPLAGAIMILATALTSSFAGLAALGAIYPMLTRGMKGVMDLLSKLTKVSALASMSLGKFSLIVLGVVSVLSLLSYGVLKVTGRWDKYRNAMDRIVMKYKELGNQIKGVTNLQNELSETVENSGKITEKERIAHERRIEDITEALKRERALGLWANQMRIKDLEKQLRREQEDWALLQKEKEKTTEKSNKGILDQVSSLLDDTQKEIEKKGEKIKNSWRILGVDSWEEFKDAVTDPKVWEETFKGVGEKIYSFAETVKGWGEWIAGKIGEGIKWLEEHPEFWEELIKEIGKNLYNAGKTLLEVVASIGTGLGLGLISSFVKTTDKITGSIEELSDAQQEQLELLTKLRRADIITQEQYQAEYERMIRDMEILRKKQEEAMPFWMKPEWKPPKIKTVPEAGGLWPFLKQLWEGPKTEKVKKKQFGGIVPGPRNQPVPIIAHGGERIIPAGEPAASGNITININNPVVRNESDIQRIAEAVSFVLGQRQRFFKLGAF
ncbi:MAG: hypothetical protein ACTSR2_02090 [Candidatus Hodarchaeales archaeon]